MADLFALWGRALVRHRRLGLLAIVLLTGLAALAIGLRLSRGLPVDFTPQALFMDGGAAIERLEALEARWGRDDNDLILLVEGELARPEVLAWLDALQAALQGLPELVAVEGIATATVLRREGEAMRVLVPVKELPPAEALAALAGDPLLRRLLISPEGDLTALRLRIEPARERVADLQPALLAIRAVLDAHPPPPGVRLTPTGVPHIRVEVVDRMMADEARFLPVVAVLFTLTITLLFRRFGSALGPLVVTLIGVVWALGLLLGLGATLNVLSVLVPTLAVVIGVSDGVHILARYREELDPIDRPAPSREQAMGETLRHLGAACALTTLTTAAGFLSLLVAETRVVRDFGLHAAVAVAAVWLAVMLVLPVWLSFFPAAAVGPRLQSDRGGPLFRGLARLSTRRPRAVLFGFALASLLAGLLAAGVRTQSHLLEMYAPTHPTARAVRLADERLGGVVPVMVHVEAPGLSLLDPALLGPLHALEQELRARPEVGYTASPASVMEVLHRAFSGEEGLPPSAEAAAQERLLAELGGASGMSGLLSEDGQTGRIFVLTRDAGGRELLALQAWLKERARALLPAEVREVEVTGDGFIASAGVERLVNDLVQSVGLMVLVIFLTMLALLRDLRLALLSVLPNVFPMLLTAAALGALGEDLQITNVVSFTVALGLAVDDTIHFMVRYLEEHRRGGSRAEAIGRTLEGAGRAIVLTSLLLVVGFGVLALSELASTRWFGLLTAVTLTGALLADLLLLPALLVALGGAESRSESGFGGDLVAEVGVGDGQQGSGALGQAAPP